MSDNNRDERVGIARLFENNQLGSYFINYIYLIFSLEVLIFLIAFIGNLGPEKGPFPWKFYFVVSFSVPIAVTFLLGICVMAFNHYIFDQGGEGRLEKPADSGEGRPKKMLLRFQNALISLRKAPFLVLLFFILVGAVLFFHSDVIFLYLANAGEKAVRYLLIFLGVGLFLAGIVAVVWIIANYKLKKRHMDHLFEYKREVMKNMNLLVMDNDMILDAQGNVISPKQPKLITMDAADAAYINILPNKKQIAS